MTLLEQIQQGESKTLELKQKLPKHEQIVKTVIAFANTSGGKLIIGVNDDRQIVGIDESDIFALQDKIVSIIADGCHPTLLPEIYTANFEGKLLLVIEVFRGNLLPYFLKKEGKATGTYIRIGASNRPADRDYILELERQKRNQSYDEEICYDQEFNTLNLKPLEQRFAAQSKRLTPKKLQNLKLIREEQGRLYPTHGLLILLGEYEHAVIKCARFKGTTMSVFIDRKEYTGDLFGQLEQAEGFIKNHINLRGEIKGLQRTDTYEIPESALREALINALIHRDYTNHGRDIKVGIYDDIVNIVSPGGFPCGLSNITLQEGRSEIRNRAIARVFKELGYIEQWGSGLQRIKDACLDQGLKEPQIQESGDFVDVEFYRPERVVSPKTTTESARERPLATDYDRLRPITTDPSSLHPDEAAILIYLLDHPKIDRKQAVALLNIKETRAKTLFNDLLEKGLIERHGQGRSTYYVLAKRTQGAE